MQESESSSLPRKRAVIIGAGPAGLTAAYELLTRTDIIPIVLEKDPEYVGGIARTVQYKGNRIDIGGHRFFSKSDRVMDWWLHILPLAKSKDGNTTITYRNRHHEIASGNEGLDPDIEDRVMLLRPRLSRIYYNGHLFDYPIKPSPATFWKLGIWKTFKIGLSYIYRTFFPRQPEKTLEDFFINRFGKELYETFFKTYTEKVWGVPCREISAEWGAQRIKGLSIRTAIAHFLKGLIPRRGDVSQKKTETSLIEQFLYPKYGPGHLWEVVRDEVIARGGEVRMGVTVTGIAVANDSVTAVRTKNSEGDSEELPADYVFSTMAIKDLVPGMPDTPEEITNIAERLPYRDFITVGLLLKKLKIGEDGRIPDTWIYIHDPQVRVCRVQFFNNWSPYLVKDPELQWVGLEYIVSKTDDIWQKSDPELEELAKNEMTKLGLIEKADVVDSMVLRMEKTYPAYFGSYDRFPEVRAHLDQFTNLFPIGRNGMHRYNNQDHSMLAAMTAVDNIIEGRTDKTNLWEINTEDDYHEEKK